MPVTLKDESVKIHTLDLVCSGLDGIAGGTSGSELFGRSLWFSAANAWW